MRVHILCILSLLIAANLQAQTKDSLQNVVLSEVEVIGYEGQMRLLETSGGLSIVDQNILGTYDDASVVFPMNSVPGIRFEERSPGSYRIAIRGSSLRAPFGVRNVKVYWNEIPFTRPTGESPLNLLDPTNFGRVEILKGPTGSIYGAGTGGVILISSAKPAKAGTSLQLSDSWGSYGMHRFNGSIYHNGTSGFITASYARHRSDGYRDNSSLSRDVLHLEGEMNVSSNNRLSFNLLHTKLDYEIPGGLTYQQFKENPRQQRPGLITNRPRGNSKNLLAGITGKFLFNNNLGNTTTLYGNYEVFENYFFDVRAEDRLSFGGRTKFFYNKNNLDITLGSEFQKGLDEARNFMNDLGDMGALNFDDDLRTKQFIAFTKLEYSLPENFRLHFGVSYNYLKYDINRLADNLTDSTYRIKQSFDPQWIPRLGLVKEFANQLSMHFSVSLGYSPPVIEEVRTNEGSLALDLQPEKGINYELGLRGNLFQRKLDFDITTFYFRLDKTIVQRQSPRGTTLFDNAGNTHQRGFELLTTWYIMQNSNLIKNLKLQTSYTYHNFIFDEYFKSGNDFSGNELTGVSPHVLNMVLSLTSSRGWYFSSTYNLTDRIPLNDANTVYSKLFHVLLMKVGYQFKIRNYTIDVFVGSNNLTNQKYSLGNDLNAFGDRYYQPTADRVFYGGLKASVSY